MKIVYVSWDECADDDGAVFGIDIEGFEHLRPDAQGQLLNAYHAGRVESERLAIIEPHDFRTDEPGWWREG